MDGTYTMTAHIGYSGASTTVKTHSYTARITGTQFALTGHDNSSADGSGGFTITSNATSGAVSIIQYCPTLGTTSLGEINSYTASGTELHLYSSTMKTEVVFTKS